MLVRAQSKEKTEREELAGVFVQSAVADLSVMPKTFNDLKRMFAKSSNPALLAVPFFVFLRKVGDQVQLCGKLFMIPRPSNSALRAAFA